MHFRLENKASQKAQEIGNLIRAYNRSKREEAESEPLNIYVEDEKGNLMAGLVAETFGNWLEIEYLFQAPDFYKRHGYKEVFTLQDYPYTGKRFYYQKDL